MYDADAFHYLLLVRLLLVPFSLGHAAVIFRVSLNHRTNQFQVLLPWGNPNGPRILVQAHHLPLIQIIAWLPPPLKERHQPSFPSFPFAHMRSCLIAHPAFVGVAHTHTYYRRRKAHSLNRRTIGRVHVTLHPPYLLHPRRM